MISKPTGLYPDNEAVSFGRCLNDTVNIFTKRNCANSAVLTTDGQIARDITSDEHGRRYVTDFIAVRGSQNYRIQSTYYSAGIRDDPLYGVWYDGNRKYIGHFTRDKKQVEAAPANAAYLRIAYYDARVRNKNEFFDADSLSITAVPLYDKGLTLSCQIQSGGSIETFTASDGSERAYVMLILWDKDRYYHFFFGDKSNASYAPRVIRGRYTTEIRLELDGAALSGINNGYFYRQTPRMYLSAHSAVIEKMTDAELSDVLRVGKSYSWKLRLYEKGSFAQSGASDTYNPSQIIGYGSVDSVTQVYDTDKKDNNTVGYALRIFPHINIYDEVVEVNNTVLPSDKNGDYYSAFGDVRNTIYNVMKNTDANIHYRIDVGGYVLPISKYRLYPYQYESLTDNKNSGLVYDSSKDGACFDVYGNPLGGYAVLNSDDVKTKTNSAIISLGSAATEFGGETYNIRTNYIDSGWGYFMLYDEPAIRITDDEGKEIGDGAQTLMHSSVDLSVEYNQAQGVGINYYSYKVYRCDENDKDYTLDYYSGNLYNQDLKITYDRLFDGRRYKICINLIDNNSRVFERTVFFRTKFDAEDLGLTVSAAYYAPHNSVVVDWTGRAANGTNVVGYRVYKMLGESGAMYEIANLRTDTAEMRVAESAESDNHVIEDFIVGDNCKYTYYVYPVILKDGKEVTAAPAVSEPVMFETGIDKVVGLNMIGDDIYEVKADEVWRLYMNLEDTGFTYNTDKNFYDTFNRYNQETVGNRKYITKSISGMLGYLDCKSGGEITDTYDMLVSWKEFSGSADLKCLIDARGLILPGNFETNPTVEYMDAAGSPATARFNWRQKSDLDIIKIYAAVLPFNPMRGTYIQSSEPYYLASSEPDALYTSA